MPLHYDSVEDVDDLSDDEEAHGDEDEEDKDPSEGGNNSGMQYLNRPFCI